MSTCCVCLKKFEGEDAPILMMHPSGTPLVLCPDCVELVDAIAGKPDSPEREEAVAALAEIDVQNRLVATELSRLVAGEDTPLDPEEGWEEEEELLEQETPTPAAAGRNGSSLYFYLGLGCLAAAFILYVILKIAG